MNSQENKKNRLAGNLPEEILLKVPARNAVLRCVCKSWNALIMTPQFKTKHFNRNNNTHQLLFIGYCRRLLRKSLSLFSQEQEQEQSVYHINDSMLGQRLDFDANVNFPDVFKECCFAGSVNGIVCLSCFVESERFPYAISFRPWVVLWNPTIMHWKLIPTPPGKPGDNVHVSVSLAFDSQSNDYKVVRLVSTGPMLESRIEIYSANHDSWIDVDQGTPVPYLTSRYNSTVIVKGVPYWSLNYLEFVGFGLGHKVRYQHVLRQSDSIAAIDPHTGEYKEIMYPPAVNNPSTSVLPFNFMDSLAVLTCLPSDYSNQMFYVYALDQTCDTWNTMYSFTQTLMHNKHISIIQCFEDAGKILLVGWDRKRSVLYDPETDSLCHATGMDALRPKWDESYRHVESLFSVNGMVPIPREDEDNSDHNRGPPLLFRERHLGLLI
ncbi:uncharacterized protein LOC141659549 [Apium graveolens]|uniref:uncharacterized protein LOC141659549 n=1 Tax=Apium graveolens TaxID=4045 RepID=UPI003D7BA8A8